MQATFYLFCGFFILILIFSSFVSALFYLICSRCHRGLTICSSLPMVSLTLQIIMLLLYGESDIKCYILLGPYGYCIPKDDMVLPKIIEIPEILYTSTPSTTQQQTANGRRKKNRRKCQKGKCNRKVNRIKDSLFNGRKLLKKFKLKKKFKQNWIVFVCSL